MIYYGDVACTRLQLVVIYYGNKVTGAHNEVVGISYYSDGKSSHPNQVLSVTLDGSESLGSWGVRVRSPTKLEYEVRMRSHTLCNLLGRWII